MVEKSVDMVKTIFMAPCKSLAEGVGLAPAESFAKTADTLLRTDLVVHILSLRTLCVIEGAADCQLEAIRNHCCSIYTSVETCRRIIVLIKAHHPCNVVTLVHGTGIVDAAAVAVAKDFAGLTVMGIHRLDRSVEHCKERVGHHILIHALTYHRLNIVG